MSKESIVNEIHKGVRKNFVRRSVVLKGIDDLWQADLMDMKNFKNINKGYKFILVVIDCFSKFVWCIPVKTKTKTEIYNAMNTIFKNNRFPKNLQTDNGTEFYNDEFKKLMQRVGINHYSTYSVKKASIVERVIRTLKHKLYKNFSLTGSYKWIDKPLKSVVDSYNNSKHRITKYKPVNVDKSNESIIIKNINSTQKYQSVKKNKFNIGDVVRISKYKGQFEKGYTPNWSTELFTIRKVNVTNPVTYYIEDRRKQPIIGTFYEQEIQKTYSPDVYLIEKILKTRGNKILVKWLGFSNKENSWIDKNTIVK